MKPNTRIYLLTEEKAESKIRKKKNCVLKEIILAVYQKLRRKPLNYEILKNASFSSKFFPWITKQRHGY